jgi:hypothetical protein
VTCAQDTSNAKGCWYEASAAACSDPGKSCAESGGAATCACPTANACPTVDAVQCGGAGQQLVRCLPSVAGSACLTWQPATDCAASGLVCSAGACACPANVGTIVYADAASGSPLSATPRPTGVATPPACRFATLTDALQAAAPPAFVKAVGWTAGGAMVFSEPGAISIGAGAILTTDDLTLNPDHYAIRTAAALTGPFVTIGPGGALEGFELRNEASTGAGVETSCKGASDLAPVSLSGVRVVALGGAPPVRFVSGVHVNGQCGIAATNLTVTGAATGILVDPAATTVESTITAPHVSASTGAGLELRDGKVTFVGGTVDANGSGTLVGTTGTGAPSFTATGTTFSGNMGDAIYVARGTLVSDGCPYSSNGTHVHAQPLGGATVSVTVRNSAGAAKMTGATNSAFRLLAMGAGSALVLSGNEVVGNGAIQDYNVSTGLRRGGGVVLTPPLPGAASIHSSAFYGNQFDQVLVAASAGALDLSGGTACGSLSNSFGCYAPAGGVGVFSNGASVSVAWNHWTQQPGAIGIDVAGNGLTGFDTSGCSPTTLTCP